jgi:hypothetical protein
MIVSDGVCDKMRDLVDSGYFAEAKDLDYNLKSLSDKVSHLIEERGGSVKLSTYDRQVLEMPVTVAEELPLIINGYREIFGALMSVGMGLTLREASLAAKKATFSNDIEMYDPKDESFAQLTKTLQIEDEVMQAQPNQYDDTNPGSPAPTDDKFNVGKYVPGLNAQQQLEAENELVTATVQQLMAPSQEMQQQMEQQQQQQQQQEQEQQQPESLLEAFSGEKKPDKPKTDSKQKEEKDSDSDESDESSEPKSKGKDSEDESDSDEDSGEGDAVTQKIAKLLESVQEKMPKLMELHEKNPEAFKKVVALVQKLVEVAKGRKTAKSEQISDMTEELNKAFKGKYPYGTVKNRKKKVEINGKAAWRSVAAGQVKDLKGNPISVASHNAKATSGTEGVRE